MIHSENFIANWERKMVRARRRRRKESNETKFAILDKYSKRHFHQIKRKYLDISKIFVKRKYLDISKIYVKRKYLDISKIFVKRKYLDI